MKKIYLLLFTLLMFSYNGYSQYQGPKAPRDAVNVSKILNHSIQYATIEKKVCVQGYIIQQLDDETYIFKDSTAKIKVEIDRDKFPNIPIDENTLVEIFGEVEYEGLSPIIDVDWIRVARKE